MNSSGRASVIIGGGVIGLSVAYHLAKIGRSQVVLLERDRLTSGTSWHAAGIVGPLRASMNLTQLAKYALEFFVELERESGQATGYCQTGGVWLAQTDARMLELRRLKAMGDRNGLVSEWLTSSEIELRLPWIHTADLAGGLWVEQDGQVNPVDLCMAYAKAARALGAEIREHSRVERIESRNESATAVILADGDRVECSIVALCAGAWSRQLAASAGVDLPLAACEHGYVVTEAVDSLPRPCPIVRDLDAGIYLKGDHGKLVLGTFEANPKFWQPRADDAGFLLFDEDWEHAQPMLEAGLHRAPLIGEVGINRFINGPESFTPDSRQLMGRTPGCHNLFVAAGFNSIGVMSSAGVGKVMADWICNDLPPMDLWDVDIARMDPLQNRDDYLRQRLPEAVHSQFAPHWPFQQYRSGRNLRQSVWHPRWAERGAVFGTAGGWERPLWFARGIDESRFEYSQSRQCWWPAAKRETLHCQRHVSLLELSPLSKFEVSGQNALSFLQRVCCSDLDIDCGRVCYTLMLNRRGGIEAEAMVIRCTENRFRMIGSATSRFKDLQWLQQHADAAEVAIDDITEVFAAIGVAGPDSQALLQCVSGADLSPVEFGYKSARTIRIGRVNVLAVRFSYSGELGWELYPSIADAEHLFATLNRAGNALNLGFAGHFAIDSCRLEMGFRHWGQDMGSEDTPFDCDLQFAVGLDKEVDFIGRRALLEQQRNGCSKQLRLCEVLGDELLLLHDEPVYAGNRIVGHCTSGGQGYRCQKTLCWVMFYQRNTKAKAGLQIEIAGRRQPLKILDRPPYPI